MERFESGRVIKNLLDTLRKIRTLKGILGESWGRAKFLFAIIVSSAVTESFGLALIVPILQTMSSKEISSSWQGSLISGITKLFPGQALLLILLLLFLVLMMLKAALLVYRVAYAARFAQRLREKWMSDIYYRYLRAPYGVLHGKRSGSLVHNIIQEPQYAASMIRRSVDLLSKSVLVIALYFVLMATNWQATLVISVLFGFIVLLTQKTIQRYAGRFGKKRLKLNQLMSGQVSESIGGARQVKAFMLEEYLQKQFMGHLRGLIEMTIRFMVIKALPKTIGEAIIVMTVIGGIIFLKYGKELTIKELLPGLAMFLVVSNKIAQNVSELVNQRMIVKAFIPSLKTVHDLSQEKVESLQKKSEAEPVERINDDIRFEDIGFSYGQKPVFENLNLTVRCMKTTALVGLSGSGKSTVADLLLRLYDPTSGRIMVGNRSLDELDLLQWRSRIGFVSQDIFMFNATIGENIALGKLHATSEEIVDAAKFAEAHDFIMELPKGYDEMLGEGGFDLSGGQRQRLAIARAFVRDPDLLIFDEATSALDSKTEEMIRRSINHFAHNKTIFIISHRDSTIRNADVIYELKGISQVDSTSYAPAC